MLEQTSLGRETVTDMATTIVAKMASFPIILMIQVSLTTKAMSRFRLIWMTPTHPMTTRTQTVTMETMVEAAMMAGETVSSDA